MNTIIIKGRVCADPEMRTVGDSTKCSFRFAVPRDFKNKQTGERESDFFNVEAWGALADFVCKHFHKGKEALITGSMHSRQYEKDGQTRTAWEVKARSVEFCGKKDDQPARGQVRQSELVPVDDESLPF